MAPGEVLPSLPPLVSRPTHTQSLASCARTSTPCWTRTTASRCSRSASLLRTRSWAASLANFCRSASNASPTLFSIPRRRVLTHGLKSDSGPTLMAPDVDLTGKGAVVVGGASGLGAAIARGMAKAGAAVVLIDKDESTLASTHDQIVKAGGTCASLRLDIAT